MTVKESMLARPRRGIPIADYCYEHGIGRTMAYKLINRGEIIAFKIGKKTLIDAESADQMRERNRILPIGRNIFID